MESEEKGRPKRDKRDRDIEAMLETTTRPRQIIFSATGSEEKDFDEAEDRLAEAQAERNKAATDAKKKVRMC